MSRPKEKTNMRGPIAWMAGNTVAANVFMAVLLIGGLLFGSQIKREVMPDFVADTVQVSVSYPGASPEEVERGVLLVVEQAVQGLDGVKEVTATASEGSGSVTVEAVDGVDLQKLSEDIRSEVTRITSFPDEADEPVVAIPTHRREVMSLILYGDQSKWTLRQKAEEIRDTLIQDQDITQVDLQSVDDFEISIEVPEENLRRYGLTLAEIASQIEKAAVDLPGGAVKTSGGEILVRMKESKDYGREFALIPIINAANGSKVPLEDLAVITDGFEETDMAATYNGQPAVEVEIFRVGDQTPVSVASAVKRNLVDIKESLPPGLNITILNDMSEVYQQRMDLLLGNAYLGLALVFILLALFLEIRLAFWVSLGIPISILGAFLFLPSMNVSINMMSMFAFIVTLGIVVDDAIVVGENIYSHRQRGLPLLEAAIAGAREVAVPVVFSVLTNIVAFLPIALVPGTMGKIFKVLPLVVVTVFTISLVECLFILPAHLSHQRPRPETGFRASLHRRQKRFSEGFSRFVTNKYGPFLNFVLRNRYVTVSVGCAILILAYAYVGSGRLPLILSPTIESDYSQATATLPYGSAWEKTNETAQRLIRAAQAVGAENGGEKLVEGILAQIGTSAGSHVTRVRVFLTDAEVRPISTSAFTDAWRKKVGDVAGLESLFYRADSGGPGGSHSSLTVELSHRDMEKLESASQELAHELTMYPLVNDVDDGFAPGKKQIDFRLSSEGRALGLTADDVARQVRYAYYGVQALKQQRGRNEVTVRVRLPREERESEHGLEQLLVRTPSGGLTPLSVATESTVGRAYTSIDRRAGRRVVTVSANVVPNEKTDQVIASLKADVLPGLLEKYPGLSYSFEGRQAEMRESVQELISGLIAAMVVVFALLAIVFKSYAQPLIIMISIPFGFVGAALGHILMGYSLSLASLFGLVALSGVVVNDSLVLIDFANRQRRDGESTWLAIQSSAVSRFRPIMLTTLTTFGGLAPMLLETSRQAMFLVPMAISLGFGLLLATGITLVLTPCFYMVLEDMGRFRRKLAARLPGAAAGQARALAEPTTQE